MLILTGDDAEKPLVYRLALAFLLLAAYFAFSLAPSAAILALLFNSNQSAERFASFVSPLTF
jgi:hypothetical protein